MVRTCFVICAAQKATIGHLFSDSVRTCARCSAGSVLQERNQGAVLHGGFIDRKKARYGDNLHLATETHSGWGRFEDPENVIVCIPKKVM